MRFRLCPQLHGMSPLQKALKHVVQRVCLIDEIEVFDGDACPLFEQDVLKRHMAQRARSLNRRRPARYRKCLATIAQREGGCAFGHPKTRAARHP